LPFREIPSSRVPQWSLPYLIVQRDNHPGNDNNVMGSGHVVIIAEGFEHTHGCTGILQGGDDPSFSVRSTVLCVSIIDTRKSKLFFASKVLGQKEILFYLTCGKTKEKK
jgi:hypothetical protein